MNLQLVYRYILSLSKNKNMFYEKKKNKKQKKKKKLKNVSNGESRTQGYRPFALSLLQLAILGVLIHEENHLRFSNSKHFRFY